MHLGRPLAPQRPIIVDVAPPPPRREMRPPMPAPGHVWIDGYWGWDNGTQVWIGGQWAAPPQPGYVWMAPRWRRHGHRWDYNPGYWRHHRGPVFIAPMGPAPVYATITISGHVTAPNGAPVPGILITLAGTQEGQILTDESGTYGFSGLPPGSYAVRPTGGGCYFAPDVANLNNLGGDVVQDIVVSGCPGW
jgi:hypothetical protein